ncbi:hypothetical protein GOV04_01335 [Candidatus Woesearchaeota archaeon]|nr:hypothetical protein [Candidatus Woesearchaeota archaeon]
MTSKNEPDCFDALREKIVEEGLSTYPRFYDKTLKTIIEESKKADLTTTSFWLAVPKAEEAYQRLTEIALTRLLMATPFENVQIESHTDEWDNRDATYTGTEGNEQISITVSYGSCPNHDGIQPVSVAVTKPSNTPSLLPGIINREFELLEKEVQEHFKRMDDYISQKD